MKTRQFLSANVLLLSLVGLSLGAAEMTRYDARSGSKMKIEGTSNVHDWRAESPLILGFLEVGPGFPIEPGQTVAPGKIEARGEASVKVTTITSRKENGEHYEDKMDDNIYKGLKATTPTGTNIVFHLSELTLKEAPKSKDAPYLFDSKGDLAIGGVTNKISMPVSVFIVPDAGQKITKLKIAGSTPIKMSDFKITPESFLLGAFKVGDEVTVKFEWMLGQKKPAAPAAASK